MSDISILKQILKDSSVLTLELRNGKQIVKLVEPPPADYNVTIHGMPEDSEVLIIKADLFPAPKEIFSNSRGECKRADFIIVAETAAQKVIIFIEMKGGRGSTEAEIIQQLKGAQCVIAYCQKVGQLFWGQKEFLQGYMHRFVSIKYISMNKRPTRHPVTNNIHDSPENMMKITSTKGLNFKQIAGGRRS